MHYTYDAVGNERKMTDRRGLVTEYHYDNLYRLTGETWKDASDNQVRQLDFSYDLVDNLLTATDPSASYTYAYDDLDRPTTETQNLTALPDDVEFTHGYDLVHNHTSVAAKTGPTLDFLSEYTLDSLYRVTSVTQRGQGGREVAAKHVAFTYDIASQMTDISRYSDFEVDPQELVAASHFGYDQVGRLTSIVHASTELPPATTWDGDLTTAPTSTPSDTISAYHLVYDKANRLATFESFADQFWADYDYDDRNQLTVADYSGPGSLPDDETYVFDANGNRDSVTIGSTTDDFVPGQDNRLASNGAFRFQYDEEGNRVARYIDDGDGEFGPNDTDITEYSWDHRNRLTRITERDNYAAAVDKVIEYNYDLFDRRISKTVDPDGSTGSQQLYRDIFVYDGEHIALEFHDADADGMSSVPAVSHRYLHGPVIDMILADEQTASGTGPGEVYWALPDHLGSTRDVIDSSGTIVGHFVYDTFGKIVSETNPALGFRFTFTGRERDIETPDLMYYRARYYSTIEGAFISKDPIGFNGGDANLYRYVGNQPTTHTDPSGLIDTFRFGDRIGGDREPTWWQRWFLGMKTRAEQELEAKQQYARFVQQRRAAEKRSAIMNKINKEADLLFVVVGGNCSTEGGNHLLTPGLEHMERDIARSLGMTYDQYLNSILAGASSEDREAFHDYNRQVAELRLGASSMPVVGMARTSGGRGAFRQAKRDLRIPMSQKPKSVRKVPLTDRNGRTICGKNGQPILTREYVYDLPDGGQGIIQDHSGGHQFGTPGGVGDQGPHFNVRPADNPRTGSIPGTQPHYPFGSDN